MIPIFSQDLPVVKTSENLVKSTWGEDKTSTSWIKREVQLHVSIGEEGRINIQEKIRYPLLAPFRKAYKWVRRLFSDDLKFVSLARLSVETSVAPKNPWLLSEFMALDSVKKAEVLANFNQKDIQSWEKETIKKAIDQAVAIYAEKPDENYIQPWHTFHKVISIVSETVNSDVFDKIEQVLVQNPVFVQHCRENDEAQQKASHEFEWQLLGSSIKSISKIKMDAEPDMDLRLGLIRHHVKDTILNLAKAEFEDHADKEKILSLLEEHITDEVLDKIAEDPQTYLDTLKVSISQKETKTPFKDEVDAFIEKVVKASHNAKDIMDLFSQGPLMPLKNSPNFLS